jgi:pseudouridine synthase
MRLQVFLSRAGISSRRAGADIIKSGRIRINNKRVLEPSFKLDPEKDRVYLDNKIISSRDKIYIMFHKPKEVTSTKRDPFAKSTVMDLLPGTFSHLNPVGRLDKDTTGLMLLTNDGDLINKLTHPRFHVEKVYSVRLDKRLQGADKRRLERGIDLDNRYTAPCAIKLCNKNNLEITMHEGRKRQIKRMFLDAGYRVMVLKRLRHGFLCLGRLREGGWRPLTEEEVSMLKGSTNIIHNP